MPDLESAANEVNMPQAEEGVLLLMPLLPEPVPFEEAASTPPMFIDTCPLCGEGIREDEPSCDYEGAMHHQDCLDDATFVCTHCNRRREDDEARESQDGRICQNCAYENYRNCYCCEELVRIARMRAVLYEDASVRVCRDCEQDYCFECEDCGCRAHQDGHECNGVGPRECPVREGQPLVSAKSSRFDTRMVGIEFETSDAKTDLFKKMSSSELLKGWTWHRDGSLNTNGMEIVSNPIGGGIIEDKVRYYYRICEESGSVIQGSEAGAHVHVNAMDIFDTIYANKDYFTSDLMDTAFKTWGTSLLPIVRLMVSRSRRDNSYCSGGFAGRDCLNWKMQGRTKLGVASYPTIAIRENTIEFRIWPSTSNVETMLTRIEFSQKVVELMYRCVTRSSVKEHRAALKAFRATCEDFSSYLQMNSLITTSKSDMQVFTTDPNFNKAVEEANRSYRAFCRMLGLSRQATNHLSKLFNRFAFNNNPILLNKTKSTIDGAE